MRGILIPVLWKVNSMHRIAVSVEPAAASALGTDDSVLEARTELAHLRGNASGAASAGPGFALGRDSAVGTGRLSVFLLGQSELGSSYHELLAAGAATEPAGAPSFAVRVEVAREDGQLADGAA